MRGRDLRRLLKPLGVAHLFASEAELTVLVNLKRKESEARAMSDLLSAETLVAVRDTRTSAQRETNDHNADRHVTVPAWLGGAA